jgi:hypothetical protein
VSTAGVQLASNFAHPHTARVRPAAGGQIPLLRTPRKGPIAMLLADFIEDAGNLLSNPLILIPMILVLLGLVGLMIFMRMKKKDDDE